MDAETGDGPAAFVHEGHRLDQEQLAAFDFALSDDRLEHPLRGGELVAGGQQVNDTKPDIMPGFGILGSRIAQAYDTIHWRCPHCPWLVEQIESLPGEDIAHAVWQNKASWL